MDNPEEMDRSLEKFNLSRLNQEEIEIMNDPFTSTETETVIGNIPKNKSPGPDGITGEFYQTFREELMPILLKKKKKQKNKTKQKLCKLKTRHIHEYTLMHIYICIDVCISIPFIWRRFSLQCQRNAMPKNVQTTRHLHSFHMLAK